MNMVPPMTTGNARTDINAIRNYLVMMSRELDKQTAAPITARDGKPAGKNAKQRSRSRPRHCGR